MLQFRDQQILALRMCNERQYRLRVRAYLQTRFSMQCDRLGPEAVERLIESGIGRARSHGFKSEALVASFILLSLLFGERFDQTCDWAAEILTAQRGQDLNERMEMMLHKAQQLLLSHGRPFHG